MPDSSPSRPPGEALAPERLAEMRVADAAFEVSAPPSGPRRDRRDLLAEIDRLTAERDEAREQRDRLFDKANDYLDDLDRAVTALREAREFAEKERAGRKVYASGGAPAGYEGYWAACDDFIELLDAPASSPGENEGERS